MDEIGEKRKEKIVDFHHRTRCYVCGGKKCQLGRGARKFAKWNVNRFTVKKWERRRRENISINFNHSHIWVRKAWRKYSQAFVMLNNRQQIALSEWLNVRLVSLQILPLQKHFLLFYTAHADMRAIQQRNSFTFILLLPHIGLIKSIWLLG